MRHNNDQIVSQLADTEVMLGDTGMMARLCNDRAVFLTDSCTLVIADLHFGKTTHFRQYGIALPTAVAERDLQRLSRLIQHYSVARLVIAGDFFHAQANAELARFADWRAMFPALTCVLVRGNHDRLARRHYRTVDIQLVDERLTISPDMDVMQTASAVTSAVEIVHEPEDAAPGAFSLCGHIHPGAELAGIGKQRLKLPCFLLNNTQLILPAFSLFSGLDTRFAQNCYRAFGLTEGAVIPL